jgi:hypothetical protein
MLNIYCSLLCWLMDHTSGRVFRAVVWLAERTTPSDY